MFKKTFSIALFLMCISSAAADVNQSQIVYEYDASGNRTSRQLLLPRSTPSTQQHQTTFIVYPTVVADVLNVTTQDEILPNDFRYTITNVSGNIVLSGNIQSQNTQIVVSLPQGYYILNLFSSTEQYSFNFLKN